MPIGKNSIKRVQNNGYSNLKTDAPDMENSVIAEAPLPKQIKSEASKRKSAVKKASVTDSAKPAAKKSSAKKASPKAAKPTEKKPSAIKSASMVPVAEQSAREGNGYVNLGGKLPIHLL